MRNAVSSSPLVPKISFPFIGTQVRVSVGVEVGGGALNSPNSPSKYRCTIREMYGAVERELGVGR